MARLHSPEQRRYRHDLSLITKPTALSWMGIKHTNLCCTNKPSTETQRTNTVLLLKMICGTQSLTLPAEMHVNVRGKWLQYM